MCCRMSRFEKTNEMLLNFNRLSDARYEQTQTDFRKHIHLLHDMRKDLDNIFRRIRSVIYFTSFVTFRLGMLQLFLYKNRLSNSKFNFLIIQFPCITITTGIHNFTQVKMHMTCVVVMKNEYIHVCTIRLKCLNFQLHAPPVKIYAKF